MNRFWYRRVQLGCANLWLAALACAASSAALAQMISDMRVVTPRAFGYTIGDEIRHELHLSLAGGYRLNRETLPDAGRLNRWLEIARADMETQFGERRVHHRIIIDYQIFNAPKALTAVTIPQLDFMVTDGATEIPVFLPEWTFTIAPITSPQAHQTLTLQSDRVPEAMPTRNRGLRLLLSVLLLAGVLGYVAYRRILLPRLRRSRYPFSRALSELKELQRVGASAENYRLALRSFHRAVNTTAGEVVFPGNLQGFLSSRSDFAALSADLQALFQRSQQVFFDDAQIAQSDAAMKDIVDLCRRCRTVERAAA